MLKKVARRGTSDTLLPFLLIIETPMAQILHAKIHTFLSDDKHENVTRSLNVPYMYQWDQILKEEKFAPIARCRIY